MWHTGTPTHDATGVTPVVQVQGPMIIGGFDRFVLQNVSETYARSEAVGRLMMRVWPWLGTYTGAVALTVYAGS